MTPEVIARAFDPFFTTKPIGQGTGLGLSMVYGFAGQSGGAVSIYSEVGKGTMICIYLPRHHRRGGGRRAAARRRSMRRAPDGGETILVVDDEPLIRMVVVEVLEELGYTVIEAGDGPSALKILNSNRAIDLLITDVGLPGGMNGRQMADAARARARTQGAVHHRLRGERRAQPRPSGPRHARDDEALPDGQLCAACEEPDRQGLTNCPGHAFGSLFRADVCTGPK